MNNIPKRPTVTEEMKLQAAQSLVADVGWDAHNADDIAANYGYGMDGFDLAKALDKWASWDTSRDDMEELDGMQSRVDQLLHEAEEKWFADNDIQPPLPIGARISIRDGFGHITEIYQYGVAKYAVKPEGQDDAATFNRRLIIKFEDAVEA
ncbi:hypothetical protein ACUTAF_01840 [Pseudomonas sp. SP16.1]|uniref:hypothetical protein n=1 Tax=Pseudomonas sp. SP16.1 TaxID=3458854 RepID=UPI00404687B3